MAGTGRWIARRVRSYRGWRLWFLLGLGSIGFIIFLLWLVPGWQVPGDVTDAKERAELGDQFRRTLAQIVFGIAIVLGVYGVWRRASAVERNVEVSKEGQITERFTKAVEQPGSENTAICLGGIYALERIAKDSPESDHRQVMEVLTAYVRENARWDDTKAAEDDDKERHPPITIQAILTVLGRRDRSHEGDDFRLDLSHTDLRGARLNEAHLEGADLTEAHLERVDFMRVIGLTRQQIDSAYTDEYTDLPGYLTNEDESGERPSTGSLR